MYTRLSLMFIMELRTSIRITLVMYIIAVSLPALHAANILLAGHGMISHVRPLHIIGAELVKSGHNVYAIAGSNMKVKGAEESGIHILRFTIGPDEQTMDNETVHEHVVQAYLEKKGIEHGDGSRIACRECELMDTDTGLNAALDNIKFDLALIDIYPLAYCLYFLPLKLKIPFISVPAALELDLMRLPLLPSFVPNVILDKSDQMTFSERLQNIGMYLFISFASFSPFECVNDYSLIRKYSDDPKLTDWHAVGRKSSMFFVPRGHLLESPTPLMPHVVELEGLTATQAQPLPTEIIQLVQGFPQGVIIVSFGSIYKNIPIALAKKFVAAFRQRQELVLWRLTGNIDVEALDLPDNVKVMKWLPQNDLLGHPNTRLFITHSGNNGQYEALYHGIPMVAAPLSVEQAHNAKRIEAKHFGVILDLTNFSTKEMLQKISLVVDDPSYRAHIQKASKIMRSRQLDGRMLGKYWVEHVLEYGADHLRSHASDMPWYAFYMVDIIGLIISMIVSFILVCISICYFIIKTCARAPNEKLKGKVKKN